MTLKIRLLTDLDAAHFSHVHHICTFGDDILFLFDILPLAYSRNCEDTSGLCSTGGGDFFPNLQLANDNN